MTVNYTIEQFTPNTVIITWPNLANGDEGQPFQLLGYNYKSIITSGTTGSGVNVDIDLSNSISSPVYSVAAFLTASSLANPISLSVVSGALIRPRISDGDGTTNLTFSLVAAFN